MKDQVAVAQKQHSPEWRDGRKNRSDVLGEEDVDVDFRYNKLLLAKLNRRLAEKESAYYANRVSDHRQPSVSVTIETLSDSDSESCEERACPKVKFSNVMIRTYSITVGDTPSPKTYPLSLDWEHTPTETLDINIFEELFSSAKTKPQRKTLRGFRFPARLGEGQRFHRLSFVTGHGPAGLYELEAARMKRSNQIPSRACSSDDGHDEYRTQSTTLYQLVDIDDYQMVDI